jgi:hypothetical protein
MSAENYTRIFADLAIADLTDDELRRIAAVARDRRRRTEKVAAVIAAATFTPGQRVRIRADAGLRPRWILGSECVVERANSTTVTVTGLPGRFARGCRVPATALEDAAPVLAYAPVSE